MKIPIAIVLVAVAASAATSQAQTSSSYQQLDRRDFFRATPGVTLRARKLSANDTAYYLIASKASAAQVLQHIAIVTGERLIAAPELKNGEVKTFSANGSSLEDLIKMTTSLYQLQSKTIAPGVRLFVSARREVAGQWAYKDRLASQVRGEQLAGYNLQVQREKNEADARANRAAQQKLRADPRYDPFVVPYGGLNPNLKGWGVEPKPQPDWEKREFNGHEFYYVPAPAAPRP